MREDTKHLTRTERLGVYKEELLRRKTEAEVVFENVLTGMGYTFEAQKVLINSNAIVDYYVPYLNNDDVLNNPEKVRARITTREQGIELRRRQETLERKLGPITPIQKVVRKPRLKVIPHQ